MYRPCFLLAVLLLSGLLAHAQWDPDAGIPLPFSRYPEVSLQAHGGLNTLSHINDGDLSTQWVSETLLPLGFLKRPDLNPLADHETYQVTGSSLPDLTVIADGSLYGMSTIHGHDDAWVTFTFDELQPVTHFYGRLRSLVAPIEIYALRDGGDSLLLAQIPVGRYVWENWPVPADSIRGIAIHSSDDFSINEVGALTGPLRDQVVMDLGSVKHACRLRSRHWSTSAEDIRVSVSQDSVTWQEILQLDPQDMLAQTYGLPDTLDFRYLRYDFVVKPINYRKVYLWEVEVSDHHGTYGLRPAPATATPSLETMIGINAFWGWGYNRYTDGLLPGEGLEIYLPVASYARNYHKMRWDVLDPDNDIDFADMAATGGTPAEWWLNWEREYTAWIDKGMPLMASLQFSDFPDTAWDQPYQSAYEYGYAFGSFFGPTHGNGQVRIVEVGNEPWRYDSTLYRTILGGMARGLKDADSNLVVLPCALQAYDPMAESSGQKNYLGARITAAEAPYLDGLNIHPYSFFRGADGIRRGVHPEHPESRMQGIYSAMAWRDHNMPGKPVYVTEFGWDHPGATEDCIHNECVTEVEATAYATRALLMMQRLGVERAVYFYHSNLWSEGLFTRSGLTGGKAVNFLKKRSFYAMQALLAEAGDRHFLGILQEDDEAWVYALGDSLGQVTHLVGWRPQAATDTTFYTVPLQTDLDPLQATLLDGLDADGTPVATPSRVGGDLYLSLSTVPVLIEVSAAASSNMRLARSSSGSEHPPVPTLLFEESEASLTPELHQAAAGLQKLNEEPLRPQEAHALAQEELSPVVSLSPVPARDRLTIQLADHIHPDEVYQLTFWDFHGRKLYSQTKNIQKENYLQVSHFPAGAYKCVIFLKDGRRIAHSVSIID